MGHYDLILALCLGLYMAECFVWVGAGGWLFLTWWGRFSAVRGPAVRLRNPWTLGHAFRLPPPPGKPDPSLSLSLPKARSRWEEFQKTASLLGWFTEGLLAIVVTSILLFILRLGYPLAWWILFSLFVGVHLSIAPLFWRAHRKYYPDRKASRTKGTLLCLVSPWQSVRAMDLLGDPLMEGFHPLVAARLFLEDDVFEKFARRWLLELRYPGQAGPDRPGLYRRPEVEQEEKDLCRWLSESGVDPVSLLAPPLPSHPSNVSYCARCEVEYSIPEGKCTDCGRDLVPFNTKNA